ncbi:methyltransferase domain-containing protein [Methanospirillum sp. J.3.6.1-F.2.7.3]|uniref:Methyltransferase domain-containing protein n=1 Tax=Methanospirillum purgamenti TaxID=2834276 RepID=A0A8E7B190_9EURY|nr:MULTISPECIES: class I SAM-dependent methyltransferase [Methanospirillum]MDX8549516.1 class I SAM-dependent methyltransferase [Methanospirillum hungatei]QVV89201.1 methyltransferase domain-containing protein [Methanospirillum sp. J.3.6.1-F.2.7.3]
MDFFYKKKYGIFSDKYQLIPAPNFMLRRNAILDAILDLKPGKLIEIGFGTGICTYEFFLRGYECIGYELEHKSIKFADGLFNADGDKKIDFRGKIFESDYGSFDYVAVFEVLEHIENDDILIKEWSKLLKDAGKLIISVPAKQKYYSFLDKVSGHVRRYEKDDLIKLLHSSGFEVEKLLCYGFPLSNILTIPLNYFYRRPQYNKVKHLDNEEKTLASGHLRIKDYKYRKIVPFSIVYIFSLIQRLFYNTNLGLGYVVIAKKRQ